MTAGTGLHIYFRASLKIRFVRRQGRLIVCVLSNRGRNSRARNRFLERQRFGIRSHENSTALYIEIARQHNEPDSNENTDQEFDHALMTWRHEKNKGFSRFSISCRSPFYFVKSRSVSGLAVATG